MSLFSAARILLLLFIYDVAFIYISILFENDLEVCMSHAILTTLVVLGILTFIRTVEKIITVKIETHQTEVGIQQVLRSEYRKVHKQRIRENLVSSKKCPNERRIIVSEEEPLSKSSAGFRLIQIDYNKKTS